MQDRANRRPYRGFTTMELAAALGIMAIVMVMVAQLAAWSTLERARSAARQGALEAAANVLEEARAAAWDTLTPEWAAARRLPEEWVRLQPDGKLDVRVEPETAAPRTKRVTASVRWGARAGVPAQEVQLVTLLAARTR